MIICLFCGFAGHRQQLMEHSAICEHHPMALRIAALEAELAEARKDSAEIKSKGGSDV